jgi:hypothetical protein
MMALSQTVVGDWRLPDDAFLETFRLPCDEDRIDPLAAQHPLPRERRLLFDAAAHVYYVDGKPVPRSVTGMLKTYAVGFDARRAAEAMMAAPAWEQRAAEHDGPGGEPATAESIVATWARNGEVQRARGQLLHFQAEQLCQGRAVEEPWSPELRQAKAIKECVEGFGLRMYRTEVSLFHAGLRIAGQPDLLARDAAGRVFVIDWKRIRALRYDCPFRSLRHPVEHLPDANYWHYALQVNVYAFMLESEYQVEVGGMYLAVVHPTLPRGRCVEVPWLREEVAAIVDEEIACGRAGSPCEGEDAHTDI